MLDRRTIGVRLNADELAALRAVAEREDRPPRLQAARLLRESLIRTGLLRDSNGVPPGGAPATAGAA